MRLTLVVPGAIDQLTGGYLYARHLVDNAPAIAVRELGGRFPDADDAARSDAAAALAALPDGAVCVIDGLALAGFRDCLAREVLRLRLVGFVHHPLAEETGLSADDARDVAELERSLLPRFAGVVCPSLRTAAALEAYGVVRGNIAIVPPGTMKPAAPIARAPHGPPLRLLSVATVTPRKGHDVLVAALARVGDVAWQLDIVGSLARDEACVAALRREIAALDLTTRVRLLGERPQAALAEAYASADIFVLASWHEGYGMAAAEALAWGLPVVACAGGALGDWVPESAALLSPPGDVAALATSLARILRDGALRQSLGDGAAKAGADLPDWPLTTRRWLAAVEGFIGPR